MSPRLLYQQELESRSEHCPVDYFSEDREYEGCEAFVEPQCLS